MISFEAFVIEDGTPIYQQIISYIQREIVAGNIRDLDELPSRRMLSALIGVNPNTIQKAYRYLEDEGIIESRSGAKSYITAGDVQIRKIRANLLSGEVSAMVKNMKQMGISEDEALSLVRNAWKEDE